MFNEINYGDLGTWVGSLAMVIAAILAFRAWKTDRDGAATIRIDAFIVTLTTGPIASARNRLTKWNNPADSDSQNKDEECQNDDKNYQDVRHLVFELLWLLHRSSGLILDLKNCDEAEHNIISHHLYLVVKQLNCFEEKLSSKEKEEYIDSAIAAEGALANLRDYISECKRKFPALESMKEIPKLELATLR